MNKAQRLLDPKNWINPKTGQRYHYFSRQGTGYEDALDWVKEFEPPEDGKGREEWFKTVKVVAQENTSFNLFWVSTVWLGIDHQFSLDGPPLIFETMVFNQKRDGYEYDMDRYTTEEQAIAGHKAIVEKCSNPLFVARYYADQWLREVRIYFRKIWKAINTG